MQGQRARGLLQNSATHYFNIDCAGMFHSFEGTVKKKPCRNRAI
jgi:hypothetical protein